MRWWLVPLLGVALGLGCALGIGLDLRPVALLVPLCLATLILAVAPNRNGVIGAVAVAVIAAGAAYGSARFEGAAARIPAGPVELEGTVVDDRPVGVGLRMLEVAVATVNQSAVSPGSPRVNVFVEAVRPPRTGEVIRVGGDLQPEARYDKPDSIGTISYAEVTVLGSAELAPDPVGGARDWITQQLRIALPEPQASLARGLLIGRPDFDVGLRDAMNRSGTSHIVAASGFNVSVVAAAVMLATTWAFGRRRGLIVTVLVVGFYALVVGDQPSVWRAAVMWWLASGAWFFARSAYGPSTLATAAAIMLLIEPWLVFDVSFQLSVIATLALILVGFWWFHPEEAEALVAGRRQPIHVVGTILIASMAAAIATWPLVGFHFGSVSLVSPVANLVVVPIVPLAMLLSGLAAAAPFAPVAVAAWVPLTFLISVIEWFGSVPGSGIAVEINAWQVVAVYLLMTAGVVLLGPYRSEARERLKSMSDLWRTHWRPPALGLSASVALPALLALLLIQARIGAEVVVWVLDVGQGDAILLKARNGAKILIDTGPDGRILLAALDKELPFWNRDIDVVVLTNHQQDHIGGLPALLERGRVRTIALHEDPEITEEGESVVRLARDHNVSIVTLGPGHGLDLAPGLSLTAVNASVDGAAAENDRSLVLLADLEGWRFLFTGDVEPDGIRRMLLARPDLSSQVLKVPHHGSSQRPHRKPVGRKRRVDRGHSGRRGQSVRPPGR